MPRPKPIDPFREPKTHLRLFTEPMVLALLAGTKTQTRRPMRPGDDFCRGDFLHVRETLRRDPLAGWTYAADGVQVQLPTLADADFVAAAAEWMQNYSRPVAPSIHMPAWAVRLRFRITGVREERVCNISEADARAEGITDADIVKAKVPEARDVFRYLWQDLYGSDSWEHDSAWVLELKAVR